MKKILLILLCLPFLFNSCKKEDEEPSNTNNNNSIYTYVPDDNFEAYLIGLGLDNSLNDTVLTAAIDTVTSFSTVGTNIMDYTGLENFTALIELHYYGVNFDFSQFTNLQILDCGHPNITNLDLSNNTALTYLDCGNSNITNLDLSNNTALETLECRNTQITNLDLRSNTALTTLWCQANSQLTSLDLRNGNNSNFSTITAKFNPMLYCVDVDDEVWSTANWTYFDSQSFFSEDCGIK